MRQKISRKTVESIVCLLLFISGQNAFSGTNYYWDAQDRSFNISGKNAIRSSKQFVQGKISPLQLKTALQSEIKPQTLKTMRFRKFYECVDGLCVAYSGLYYGRSPD